MYFKFSSRNNPLTGSIDRYYRLVESYRDANHRVCHRTILNVGFISDDLSIDQLNTISRRLTDLYQKKSSLFNAENDSVVSDWVTRLWGEIMAGNKLDVTLHDSNSRKVAIDSISHENVREVGAEWLCYNIWNELEIDKVLLEHDFTEQEIQLAQTQVISRAVYPNSELATSKWIRESSAITEITGYNVNKITKDKLYKSALKLSGINEYLQKHLSDKTNELFDIQDTLLIHDLTNTYFEGEKRSSKLAKFGRSKEKRTDAKLIVLALVINPYGFIKYSCVHEGNYADTSNLNSLLDKLNSSVSCHNPLVVMDAGIATQENLDLVVSKGFHYLCVSRRKPKEIIYDKTKLTTYYETKNGGEIILRSLQCNNLSGNFLEVKSKGKELKEQSMNNQFINRFIVEIENIKKSLTLKRGTKKADKVHQRIGRAKQKYPSIQTLFDIEVVLDDKKENALDIVYNLNPNKKINSENKHGVYYLRTSLPYDNEAIVWKVYDVIREIEHTFKTLKTDLDLRPIYHKSDQATIAHLNLGLLAYWLVNTIRCKLKIQGIKSSWKEIVRIGNTQKVITTKGTNTAGVIVQTRKCSEPELKLKEIQKMLKIKYRPFVKLKSVVHKPKLKKIQIQYQRDLEPV